MVVASRVAPAAELESLRMHEAPDYTRVVFDISAPVTYDVFTLDDPRRVVIDLEDVRAGAGFDPALVALGRERVKDVRTSTRGTGYRVVLDVSMVVDPRGFTLQPVPPYGHRLVIDLYGGARTARKPAVVTQPDGKREVVIAVDPGHGGEDPGASGPGGIREKNVVMQIARRLTGKLNKADGYRAVMVRDSTLR